MKQSWQVIMAGSMRAWMREEVRNEGASGDGLISLQQQMGVWSDASAASGQRGPKGPWQQLQTMGGRWPQGRRKVAELCNALGSRSQRGGCSFPNFSLPLDTFPRLVGLGFLLVAFCSLSVLISSGLVTIPLLVVQHRLAAFPKDGQLSSGWFLALSTTGAGESVLWEHCAVHGTSHSPPWAPAQASLGDRVVTWTCESDLQRLLSWFCNRALGLNWVIPTSRA